MALLPATPASARNATPQDAASFESDDDIIVVGDNGQRYSLTADALRDAAQAFRAHRATYAPDAAFYFQVMSAEADSGDLELYLRRRTRRHGEAEIVNLTREPSGYFRLPVDQVVDGHWELRANRRRDDLQLRPLILSPESTLTDRRFGDVRLQCRVSIAFTRLGLATRMLLGAVGPCGSSMVALYMAFPRPVASATVTGLGEPLEIRTDGGAVRMPLTNDTLSNEARLRIQYR